MKETVFNQDQKKELIEYLSKLKDTKDDVVTYISLLRGSPMEVEEVECLIKNKKCIVNVTRSLKNAEYEIELPFIELTQFLSKYNIFEWGYSSEDKHCFYFYDTKKEKNIKCDDYDFNLLSFGSWDVWSEYGEITKWIDKVSLKEKKLLEDYFEDELDSDYYECDNYEYSGNVDTSWDPGDVYRLVIDILKSNADSVTYDEKVGERVIFFKNEESV